MNNRADPATGSRNPILPALERAQRRRWTRRADSWETEGSSGLTQVVDTLLEIASPGPEADVVDLGTGTGQLALPLARIARKVWAVDISSAMLAKLSEHAAGEELDNVSTVESSIESIDFPASSLDLVVSNYALHHLLDADKKRLVARAFTWLRPGGRIVIGDMMFGRGADARDREIVARKIATLARKGPGGWWRIAKNMVRYSLRLHEHPVSIASWSGYLESIGFVDIEPHPVVAEAVVLAARKPEGTSLHDGTEASR